MHVSLSLDNPTTNGELTVKFVTVTILEEKVRRKNAGTTSIAAKILRLLNEAAREEVKVLKVKFVTIVASWGR